MTGSSLANSYVTPSTTTVAVSPVVSPEAVSPDPSEAPSSVDDCRATPTRQVALAGHAAFEAYSVLTRDRRAIRTYDLRGITYEIFGP